ncbi:MAG: prohibitin family protein [Clostridia bacterium]|nr:prohibitin family protein [Clostridia bacterium]MBO4429382.1 prohibitin family protein [Clostridia bacterium]
MGKIIFAIIVGVIAFIALGFCSTKNAPKTLFWKTNKKQWASALALLIIVFGCFTTISTGHTGIVTTFGKVEDATLEAGMHFILPWQETIEMDNRNQKAAVSLQCFSSDIQEVDVNYTLNYQISKENAQEIYRTIGTGYYDTVILPRIEEAVKTVFSKYDAENLISNRENLSTEIKQILEARLATYHIEVIDASVENMDFSDAFTNAVEEKQVAAQNKLKAETEQAQRTMEQQAEAERNIIKANADAQTAVIAANADLDIVKIQADAAEYAGQKDAAINKAIAESLTPELLYYYYIKGWDGKLPSTYISQEDFMAMFQINAGATTEAGETSGD